MRCLIAILAVAAMALMVLPSESCAEDVVEIGRGWSFEGSATIPLVKMSAGKAHMYVGAGGGLAVAYTKKLEDETKMRLFSFSPATLLFEGDMEQDGELRTSWAATVGFFNDKIMFGGARYFDTGKWYALFSVGVNFR